MIEPKGNIVLIECYECKGQVSEYAVACPHCGAVRKDEDSLAVVVTDMDMGIFSMIWFLIKVSIAAVPAVIVIYTAWTIVGGILNPFLHM